MKVTIVTVSFNNRETLEKTISSVYSQNFENLEYIVVDGKSTDGTKALLRQHDDKITEWISEPDEGMYDAMNKGIEMASGDVIGFLHADDFYTGPNVITNIVEVMKRERTDACYADLHYVDSKHTGKVVRRWNSGEYEDGAFLNGWMPPHPTFFVKRKIYDTFGGFKTNLGTAADYELMLRFLHKHKISVSYLPETIVKMRTGGNSNSSFRNRLLANRYDRKAWAMNGLSPRFYTLYLKPLRKLGQFVFS